MIRGTVNDRPEPHHRRVYMRTILSDVFPLINPHLNLSGPFDPGYAE